MKTIDVNNATTGQFIEEWERAGSPDVTLAEARTTGNFEGYWASMARRNIAEGRATPISIPASAMASESPEITAVRDGVRMHAIQIAQLCDAAGKSHLAGDFIRRKLSVDQAKFELTFGTAKPWREVMASVTAAR